MIGHPEIRLDDPHGPCPFCGCGMASDTATKPAKRAPAKRPSAATYTTASGRQITLKGKELRYHAWRARTPSPDGPGPASWAYPETGTRRHTPTELAELERIRLYFAGHRGMVAIVDEKTNTITGWRPAPGKTASVAA